MFIIHLQCEIMFSLSASMAQNVVLSVSLSVPGSLAKIYSDRCPGGAISCLTKWYRKGPKRAFSVPGQFWLRPVHKSA